MSDNSGIFSDVTPMTPMTAVFEIFPLTIDTMKTAKGDENFILPHYRRSEKAKT